MLMFVSVGRARRREKVTGFWDNSPLTAQPRDISPSRPASRNFLKPGLPILRAFASSKLRSGRLTSLGSTRIGLRR
jgi:hypothetical protein